MKISSPNRSPIRKPQAIPAVLFLIAAMTFSMGQASAADIIYGSGDGTDPSTGVQRDLHWTIAAVPFTFTPPDRIAEGVRRLAVAVRKLATGEG